jgi:ABC-2 type transport system permease protein
VKSFIAIYKLVLRHQLTRGRVILIGLAIALCGLLGFLFRNDSDTKSVTVGFVSLAGLGLIIPVISLLLGSGAMGDWHNDETLVYVWLRPVRRLTIAAAAIAAAMTVAIPANLLPMIAAVTMAQQTGEGVLSGTIRATVLVTLAYTSVFTVLGIVVRKPLAFGLIYIFIWEFFVSRAADGAARLSINSYGASMLSRASDIPLDFAGRAEWSTNVVPITITAVAIGLAALRLQRMEVA